MTRRRKRRAAAAASKVPPRNRDWPGSHERKLPAGAGPYEACYDVTHGYCVERLIILP